MSRVIGDAIQELQLEAMLEDEALVSCTPCWDRAIVLPTEVVPYAEHMMWAWDIEYSCKVNMALVIAKTTHRFPLPIYARRLHKGDALEFDLYAKDLDHGH